MMRDIGQERRDAFSEAAAAAAAGGPTEIVRHLQGMLDPISQDLEDLINRYGRFGWPVVAVAMKTSAERLAATLDPMQLKLYLILLDYVCCISAVATPGNGQVNEGAGQ